MDNQNIVTVFQDVRKAYRLVYQYQRRIMDLVAYIGNYLGFTYDRGEQRIGRYHKKDKLNFIAWDYLAMYNFTFIFNSRTIVSGQELKLIAELVSDTGYYDVATQQTSLLNLNHFNSINNSKTELHLIIKRHGRTMKDYRAAQYPSTSIEPFFYDKEDPKGIIIGYKFNLSELMNEVDTLSALKIFEDYCEEQGVVLRKRI